MANFGVIAYVALQSGISCEQAFQEMVHAVVKPSEEREERADLLAFAREACRTTNPDIIWQLAYQESGFRFAIARENFAGGTGNLYLGEGVDRIVRRLRQKPGPVNIDLGVMQFNWAYHREGFGIDPERMLKPEEQIRYFLRGFSGEIYGRCKGRWIGCYHNSNDKSRANRYEAEVLEKGRYLRLHALQFIRQKRKERPDNSKDPLPPIRKEDVDQLLAFAREMPIPLWREP